MPVRRLTDFSDELVVLVFCCGRFMGERQLIIMYLHRSNLFTKVDYPLWSLESQPCAYPLLFVPQSPSRLSVCQRYPPRIPSKELLEAILFRQEMKPFK